MKLKYDMHELIAMHTSAINQSLAFSYIVHRDTPGEAVLTIPVADLIEELQKVKREGKSEEP